MAGNDAWSLLWAGFTFFDLSFILMAGSLFATDQLLAGVAILSAMGLIVGWLIGRAERWLLRWRS